MIVEAGVDVSDRTTQTGGGAGGLGRDFEGGDNRCAMAISNTTKLR